MEIMEFPLFFGFMVLLGLRVGRFGALACSGALAGAGARAVTQKQKKQGQTVIAKNTWVSTRLDPLLLLLDIACHGIRGTSRGTRGP